MQTFKYTALSKDGAKVSGVVDGIDEFAAVTRIKAQYPIVLKIEEVKKIRGLDILNADLNKKVDTKALSVMCSQFAIMLRSGMNIASCMEMISGQTKDKKLKEMLHVSAQDVAQGITVADAFSRNYPELPITFIENVRAGELSGNLEMSFENLKKYYEKDFKLKQKMKQTMSYPIFVIVVAVVVLLVIMIKVMPTLTSVFDSLGGDLPAMTQFLINSSNFFQKTWMYMVGGLVLLIIIWQVWIHTEAGKKSWNRFLLKMPVLGNINTLNGSAEFANTMASLLQAGLTISHALDVTSKVLNNYILSMETKAMVDQIETGRRLGECMRKCKHYPQVLTEMTAIGEDTGELESTLEVIGDYYQNEADYATTRAIDKLEPTMLIFLAIFAGFIVIGIYLPMFTMYDLM